MTCQEAVEWMQRDLDHDLSDSERQALVSHMSRCPDCAEMFTRLQQLSLELAQLPKVTPPYSLVDAILPRLEELDRERIFEQTEKNAGPAVHPFPAAPAAGQRGERRASRWKRLFPFSAIGGVVAAGIVLTLFITNQGGLMKNKETADTTLLSVKKMTSEGATASGGAAPTSNGSAERSVDVTSNTASPVAPPSPSATQKIAPAGDLRQGNAQDGGNEAGSGAIDPTKQSQLFGANLGDAGQSQPKGGEAVSISDVRDQHGTPPPNPETSNTSGIGNEVTDTYASPGDRIASGDKSTAQGGGAGSAELSGSINKSSPGSTEGGATDSNSAGTAAGMMPALPPDASMGIAGIGPRVPVTRLQSPDASRIAVYDPASRQVKVVKAGDEKAALFVSARIWEPTDSIHLNSWTSAERFSYSVTRADGSILVYSIELMPVQERLEVR
ncbi:zf-HC2 domain-containing protein [Paenibacillus koleovorans]|uniref:zf-HC2 domain-containing protein n=1 Tax=Paenibacillus koleovorans TaxID=121608 RepID=UPI000FDACBEA|nr:zf-HC2 domain-containing protein [Paenibacillus koleovorans]